MFAFFQSPVQLLIVGMIVLLLIGNRLPNVMQSLGKWMLDPWGGPTGRSHARGQDGLPYVALFAIWGSVALVMAALYLRAR